ncbi:MAG TPA: hypothetical protein VKJ65_00540, partial [Phycisphaerae bacterium]|nr:hypothetical protein [Phycisphaerae bacterium]
GSTVTLDAYGNDSGGTVTVVASGSLTTGAPFFNVNYSHARVTPGHPVISDAGSSGLTATVHFDTTNVTTSGFQVTSPGAPNAITFRINYGVFP